MNNTITKAIFLFLCMALCCLPYNGIAQTIDKAYKGRNSIQGKVTDKQTGEPMQSCTIALCKGDSTTMITGCTTTANGTWTIKGIAEGRYVLKVSFVGYDTNYTPVSIAKSSSRMMEVGTIRLSATNIELEAAVVTGQLKEMEVKDDTVVYNADAFKVPEGSMLEELIRKLPGAEVEDDGTVKIQGKTVKKFLVEGKEFFSGDKQMAMKNLPSEIVDKLKTYDRQSDFSRITGIDDGEEETVIDIGIKKGMKKGWFGQVSGGYGTKDRYTSRANVNRFEDKRQMTFIGSLNNTNDQTGGGGGRGGNNGVTTSGMGGYNMALGFEKWEVGGDVRYNGRKSNVQSYNSSQNFVSTRSSFSNSRNVNDNSSNGVNANFKIEWKPDSVTTVNFRPNASWGNNHSESEGLSATYSKSPYSNIVSRPLEQEDEVEPEAKINRNNSRSWSEGKNYSIGGNLLYNRRIGGAPWFGPSAVNGLNGRNLSLRVSGSMNKSESKSTNFSNVIYYQRGGNTDITYRHRNTPDDNKNYSVGAGWSEPIMRNLFAQANYSYNYSKRHSAGQAYDFARADSIGRIMWEEYGQYGMMAPNYLEFLNDSLSRYTDNINKTHNFDFSLRLITQLLNISAGVRVERQNQKMVYQYQGLDTIASRSFVRISPTLNARFRFTKQHSLIITYRGNSSQPNMTDMFNLTDNSNPLNIREGNPDLKPSFTNNININYNNNFVDRRQVLTGRFSFSNTLNSISNRTEYNEQTGGQTTRPENINGDWNINGNIGFNTPLFWEKLTLNTNTSARYQNHVSYIYQNRQTMMNTVKQTNLGESLSLTLRMGTWDVRANGRINWTESKSELINEYNRNTYNFSYGLSSTGNFDNGFGFSTDIHVSSRRGYSSSEMNTNEVIWNAQVSYRFLKNKRATISLQAFDLLQQRSNISRSISATSQRDTETNSINNYFMATFIYRIRTFGDRQSRQALRESRMMDAPYERGTSEERTRGMRPGGSERSGSERGGQGGGRRGR